jgi:glycine cleavage system regulatory protein
MTTRIILTAIGADRPGLTQGLAGAVLSAGGNWLESHLSHLGGQFVGSVLVELDAGKLGALETAVQDVVAGGFHVSIVPAGETRVEPRETLTLDLVGQDRPGIVHEVTAVLARLDVNIEDFASATENGSWSGELLFRARARLTLPAGTPAAAVQDALEAISGDIMVDFVIGTATE